MLPPKLGYRRDKTCTLDATANFRRSAMLPLLALHSLAAPRGDGLKPELLALLLRQAQVQSDLSAMIVSTTGALSPEPAHATASTIADDPGEPSVGIAADDQGAAIFGAP